MIFSHIEEKSLLDSYIACPSMAFFWIFPRLQIGWQTQDPGHMENEPSEGAQRRAECVGYGDNEMPMFGKFPVLRR